MCGLEGGDNAMEPHIGIPVRDETCSCGRWSPLKLYTYFILTIVNWEETNRLIAGKDGDDESLENLDWFRFVTAPNKYMSRDGDEKDIPLEKEDAVRLVKWKL